MLSRQNKKLMENKKGKKKLGLQKIKIAQLNQNRLSSIKGGFLLGAKTELPDEFNKTNLDNACENSDTCRSYEREYCIDDLIQQ